MGSLARPSGLWDTAGGVREGEGEGSQEEGVEDRSRARGTGVCVLALHESGWQQQARGCVNKAGVLVRL